MDDAENTAPNTDDAKGAADLVTDAEQSGKLKPLDDLMREMGWDETSGTLLLLAQKDERTRGKSPEELAAALREDPALYDDLEAYKPGGALEKLGEKPEPPAEPSEEDVEAAGKYTEESMSMKGADKKKAHGAMMAAGASRPSELDKDFDKKRSFMESMAGE